MHNVKTNANKEVLKSNLLMNEIPYDVILHKYTAHCLVLFYVRIKLKKKCALLVYRLLPLESVQHSIINELIEYISYHPLNASFIYSFHNTFTQTTTTHYVS